MSLLDDWYAPRPKKATTGSVWKRSRSSTRYRSTPTTYYDYADYSTYGDIEDYTETLPATRQWLNTMASAFSGTYNVKLNAGDTWRADTKTRTLTYPSTQLETLTRKDALALILHQVGMTVYADPITAEGMNADNAQRLRTVMHTLEDARITDKIRDTYANGATVLSTLNKQGYEASRVFLENLRTSAFNAQVVLDEYKAGRGELKNLEKQYDEAIATLETMKGAPKKIAEMKKARESLLSDVEKQANALKTPYVETVSLLAQRYYYGEQLGYYTYSAPFLNTEAEKLGYAVAQKMIAEDIGACANTGEAIAFYVVHLLPLVANLPVSHQNPRQQKKNPNPRAGDSTADALERSGRTAGAHESSKKATAVSPKEAQKADKAKAKADARALDDILDNLNKDKAVKETKKGAHGYGRNLTRVMSAMQAYAYYVEPYRGYVSRAVAYVNRKLDVNKPKNPSGAYTRGAKLNVKRLYRHRLDDPKLFARRETTTQKSHAYYIAVDVSGSTQSRYSNETHRAITDEMVASALVSGEILERTEGAESYAISAFASYVVPMKRSSEVYQRSLAVQNISDTLGGGTSIEEAFDEGMRMLKNSKATDRHMVIITDGEFTTGMLPRMYAKQISSEHIQLTLILVGRTAGRDAVRHEYAWKTHNKRTSDDLTRKRLHIVGIPISQLDRLVPTIAEAIATSYR